MSLIWILLLHSLFICLQISINRCNAVGVFEVRVRSFQNDLGLASDEGCCSQYSGSGSAGWNEQFKNCSNPCRTFLTICFTHYMAEIPDNPPCSYGQTTSSILGSNSFNDSKDYSPDGGRLSTTVSSKIINSFSSNNNSTDPLLFRFPFDFAWTKSFSLIVNLYHDLTTRGPAPGSQRRLIYHSAIQRAPVPINFTWTVETSRDIVNLSSSTSQRGAQSVKPVERTLVYEYRAVCGADYYGDQCTVGCTPHDDINGHYTCVRDREPGVWEGGNEWIKCLTGWTGSFCTQAVCREGCNMSHGFCHKPGECNCQLGWQGDRCDECITYPGCLHGNCELPWQCTCESGWGGFACNLDLNYCTTHRPCINGATCSNTGQGSYTCRCLAGYTGTNCEMKLSNCLFQPCMNNGICQKTSTNPDYKCVCPPGFYGSQCEMSTNCTNTPCKNGGTCELAGSGSPSTPRYRCVCPPGFTGLSCSVDIDNCASSPCDNGGRCIDEINGYRCLCPQGYTGPNCWDNMDDCTSSAMCLHGGTCVDGPNSFTCLCPPGFNGSICQNEIAGPVNPSNNPCASSPCLQSGTCRLSSNCFSGANSSKACDYVCDCVNGYQGKNCQNQVTIYQPNAETSTKFASSAPIANSTSEMNQAASKDGLTWKDTLVVTLLSVILSLLILVAVIVTAALILCKKRRQRQQLNSGRDVSIRGHVSIVNNLTSQRIKCTDTNIEGNEGKTDNIRNSMKIKEKQLQSENPLLKQRYMLHDSSNPVGKNNYNKSNFGVNLAYNNEYASLRSPISGVEMIGCSIDTSNKRSDHNYDRDMPEVSSDKDIGKFVNRSKAIKCGPEVALKVDESANDIMEHQYGCVSPLSPYCENNFRIAGDTEQELEHYGTRTQLESELQKINSRSSDQSCLKHSLQYDSVMQKSRNEENRGLQHYDDQRAYDQPFNQVRNSKGHRSRCEPLQYQNRISNKGMPSNSLEPHQISSQVEVHNHMPRDSTYNKQVSEGNMTSKQDCDREKRSMTRYNRSQQDTDAKLKQSNSSKHPCTGNSNPINCEGLQDQCQQHKRRNRDRGSKCKQRQKSVENSPEVSRSAKKIEKKGIPTPQSNVVSENRENYRREVCESPADDGSVLYRNGFTTVDIRIPLATDV